VGKTVDTVSVRILFLQIVAHALIFAAQNACGFAERALLATDTAAIAALGVIWTAFSLLSTFTTNVVGVCQLVVGRRCGEGDESGARAAARQALLLALGGGALGLAVAVASLVTAVFTAGVARGAAFFLAAQGLALGPLLAARALTDYSSGTMRVGLRLLVSVSVLPVAVHLALVWLLTGLLSWSVPGAGLARLGAALAAVVAALLLARAELGTTVNPPRWWGDLAGAAADARRQGSDRALLWTMLAEGSVLGLQQVVAGLMVLLLYLGAASAGHVTSAALTLTHAGVYPLLFCFAWGSSQAVGAAAAQAVGRRDARALARVIWLGLGLSAVLAFALPWGAYTACGRQTLAWLLDGGPAGQAVLATSVHFMGLLAIFFVLDFAINFLSALLRAAKEQGYLLKVTAAAAAGFGLLLIVGKHAPPPPGIALPCTELCSSQQARWGADGAWLLGAFITAQAGWAGLLLLGVVRHWPARKFRGTPPALWVAARAETSKPAGPPGLPRRIVRPSSTAEHHAMTPFQPSTALSPTLRALALGLLVETVLPLLHKSRGDSPVPPDQDEAGAAGNAELWQALRGKCGELSALVLRADDPHEAAAYVLSYLPKDLDYVFELVRGQKRPPEGKDVEARKLSSCERSPFSARRGLPELAVPPTPLPAGSRPTA
jgi:Na+-driven multidrug efflux pump